MAVEIFEGNIASEMTLGEAIIRGILPEPKYVIATYSYKKELDQLKKRIKNLSNKGLIEENKNFWNSCGGHWSRRMVWMMFFQSIVKEKRQIHSFLFQQGTYG